MPTNDNLVIYPMPSLVSTLLKAERSKGRPLTEEEVNFIRDNCPSVAVPRDVVPKIDEERGYKDIDPEFAWEEWQDARKYLVKE